MEGGYASFMDQIYAVFSVSGVAMGRCQADLQSDNNLTNL